MSNHIISRVTAAAVSALLLCTTSAASFTAFAENTQSISADTEESARMKTALGKVKKRFTVPEHVSEFSYTYKYDFSTDCFKFTWETPEDSDLYERYAAVIIDDIIVFYNHTKSDGFDEDFIPSFAKLTDEEIISKAKEHLKRLNPDVYKHGVYTLNDIQLYGNKAHVQFQRKENGIIVDGNGFEITLDQNTGELYRMEGCWWDDTEFPDASEMLDMDELQQVYKDSCKLTPYYNFTTDENWATKGVVVYYPDFYGETDAFTGKSSAIWEDMKKDKGVSDDPHGYDYHSNIAKGVDSSYEDDDISDAGTEGDYFGDTEFTEEELKKIDESKEYLSRAQLKEILCSDPYLRLYKDAELKSYKLYEDNVYTEDYYALCYEADDYYADVFVNARTGQIYFYDQSCIGKLSDTEPYPVEECLEKAKAAVKHFYPDICGEFRSAAENKAPSRSWKDYGYETRRSFDFVRYVNGIEVENDFITVAVTNDGQVTDVDYFYTEATFEEPKEFDKDKAFEKLFSQNDINLYYDGYYKPDGTVQTYLIYNIDSFTLNSDYDMCYHNGTPVTRTVYQNMNYTDISGHKYEKAITTLARYGITLKSENGKFEPDKPATGAEFESLIEGVLYDEYYDVSDIKSTVLTRELAAKIIVSNYADDYFLTLDGLFKSPYSDVSEDNEYIGHIAAAKALGFMSGQGDKFYPKSKITRGGAMQLVYNFIKNYHRPNAA